MVGVQGTKDRGEEEGTSQGAIGIEILQTLQAAMKTVAFTQNDRGQCCTEK